jgi:hypothetical protein
LAEGLLSLCQEQGSPQAQQKTMVLDNEHHTCIICCLAYNVTKRRPFDLG